MSHNPVIFVDPTGLFGDDGWLGTRATDEKNTTGFQGSDNFFAGEEGPVMDALDNYMPGFHSYSSLFHDPLVVGMMDAGFGSWIKFPTMVLTVPAVPAFAIMDTIVDAFRPDNQGCRQ